jgi:hypothetical protein
MTSWRVASRAFVVLVAFAVSAIAGPANASGAGAVRSTAATPTWLRLMPAVEPAARVGASMAYDPVHRTLVLWGGGGTTGVVGDTWAFNGSTWHPLATGPARIRSSLVFDSRISSFVAFGGSSATGVTGDTWKFTGTTWTRLAVSGPPAREGASMAYDPRLREVVLFGGVNDQAVALGDTWAWKPVTGWVELAPARPPDARFGASIVYDRQLRKLVLFGGETAGGVQNDTWSFDGSSWQPVTTPTSPPPRVQHAMTYDTRLHAVVMWGGVGIFGDLSDTWFFNGSRWTTLGTGGTGPRADQGQEATLAYDSAIRAAILIGGGDSTGHISNAEWALR